ncbi:hypothetical protein LSAT2_022687 [Lamellibrachia satsuma]|nr:hypothetical protein LSAT2_022687 [Lamellibrachia satsuma]
MMGQEEQQQNVAGDLTKAALRTVCETTTISPVLRVLALLVNVTSIGTSDIQQKVIISVIYMAVVALFWFGIYRTISKGSSDETVIICCFTFCIVVATALILLFLHRKNQGMCEDEGTRGGHGMAEAVRCGIGGKRWGELWMIKWGKVMRKMLGKAHLSLG